MSDESEEILKQLADIKKYFESGNQQQAAINDTLTKINVRCKNVELMVHGDPLSGKKLVRDGINRRVEALEKDQEDHIKVKERFLKIAIGSITMAVGSFIYWLWKCLMAWIHTIKGG